jgi:hypothetical protein
MNAFPKSPHHHQLTMLGVFCFPDFVVGIQPCRSHGIVSPPLSSSSSSDSLLYIAVGEVAVAHFSISKDLTTAAAEDEAAYSRIATSDGSKGPPKTMFLTHVEDSTAAASMVEAHAMAARFDGSFAFIIA